MDTRESIRCLRPWLTRLLTPPTSPTLILIASGKPPPMAARLKEALPARRLLNLSDLGTGRGIRQACPLRPPGSFTKPLALRVVPDFEMTATAVLS